jgi:dipeptidase E
MNRAWEHFFISCVCSGGCDFVVKFYLSSFRLGSKQERLKELAPNNNARTAYISNALDFSDEPSRRKSDEEYDMNSLRKAGLQPELLDLREFFGKEEQLRKEIAKFGVIWVSGGSVFVLLQAMRLSGLDTIIKDMFVQRRAILYGGYSAGVCVLARSLSGIELMDDPALKPYGNYETIWEGLGILDYLLVPHYKSDHPESKAAEKVVEYMIDNKLPFKTLRDGEVIIIDRSA